MNISHKKSNVAFTYCCNTLLVIKTIFTYKMLDIISEYNQIPFDAGSRTSRFKSLMAFESIPTALTYLATNLTAMFAISSLGCFKTSKWLNGSRK